MIVSSLWGLLSGLEGPGLELNRPSPALPLTSTLPTKPTSQKPGRVEKACSGLSRALSPVGGEWIHKTGKPGLE